MTTDLADERLPDPYVASDWRECSACHGRKPAVTGTPPRCRLCRELAEMPKAGDD